MLVEEIIGDGEIITRDKVLVAIDRLKAFEPEEGYYLAFSGGKDSVVIKALADMAGVKYDAHYSLTTVDPPELVRFIKDRHKDVAIDYPKESMWKLIVKNGIPPTRIARYCCLALKEASGVGRVTITGVRWAESNNRLNSRHVVDIGRRKDGIVLNDDNDEARRTVEQCYRTRKTLVNPIVDWSNEDVWEFIKRENIPYCTLYDHGKERLGCIGCPMNTKRSDDFKEYPTYKKAYVHAFDRMIKKRIEKGQKTIWENGEACFDWWMQEKQYDDGSFDNQIEMEDE